MNSDRSWIGSVTTIERAFPTERASAPQPSATAQPTATQSDCAWRHWSSDWQKRWGARRSRDGVRGRDGILSPFLGGSRVDDYNTEATDVYSTAATKSLLWPYPSTLRSGVSTFPRHSDQTATRPAPQISEERRQTVETARRSWIRKLIDLSRRNNLLYFRPLKTGTLNSPRPQTKGFGTYWLERVSRLPSCSRILRMTCLRRFSGTSRVGHWKTRKKRA